jgi:hypothetical protein
MAQLSNTPFKDYKNPLVALEAVSLYASADQLEKAGNINAAAEVRKTADSIAAQVVPKSSNSRAVIPQIFNGAANVAGNAAHYLSDEAKKALNEIVASLQAAVATIDDKAQAALGDVLTAVNEMVNSGAVKVTGDAQMIFQTIADALGKLKTQLEEGDIQVPVKEVVSAIANALSFLTQAPRQGGAKPSAPTDSTSAPRDNLRTRLAARDNLRTRLAARRANRGKQPLLQRVKDRLESRKGNGLLGRVLSRLHPQNADTTQPEGGKPLAPPAVLRALRDRLRRPRSGVAPGDSQASDVRLTDPAIIEILRYLQPLINGTPLESTEFVLFVAPHDAAAKVATLAYNHGLIKPDRYSALVSRLDKLYTEAKYNPLELSDAAIYGGTKIAVPVGMDLAAIVVQILNQIIEIVINIVYQVVVKIPGINFIPLPASLPPLLTAFVSPLITAILRNDTLQAYLAVAVYLLLDVPFEVASHVAARVMQKLTPQELDTVRARVFNTILTNLEAI